MAIAMYSNQALTYQVHYTPIAKEEKADRQQSSRPPLYLKALSRTYMSYN